MNEKGIPFPSINQSNNSTEDHQLLEIQKIFPKIFELSSNGILVIGRDFRIEFTNIQASELSGFPKDQLIGKDFRDLISPEDREKISNLTAQMHLRSDESTRVSAEFKLITKSKATRDIDIYLVSAPLEGSFKIYAYLRDLSERIRIENKLREANRFLTNIIFSSVDGIIAADIKGNIIIFNQGAARMLGYSADEVINGGVHITQIYIPGQAKELMRRLRCPDFGEIGKLSSTEISAVTKQGEILPASLSAAIIYDEAGREIASVGIFTDLRERIRMQKELEETHLKLLHSEKMASLGKLAAGVAHEINNPLGGILLYANLLLEDMPPDHPRSANVKKIIDQTLRCKDIVKELLDFGRQAEHNMVTCNINQVLEQSISLLSRQSSFLNIKIVKDMDPLLLPIVADPGQLNQVFINLMTNAADAMNGMGILTVRTYSLPEENKVGVDISDTGCGIPPETLPRIFDPFFTTKDMGKGTGLGLSTVYGIIGEHGGTIDVRSQLNEGSTFILRLPAQTTEAEGGWMSIGKD
ncbi:MAG: PAS domain S-box protein [Deltaproteobacteria bacterium]|nr:PAS domain S-box protein [Deltaproteobacteria bacterium]